MLASDLRALQESYQDIYEEGDGISCEMIEEIVEELVEECVEFGYSIDEATTAVENATILYIDEAKVTYGSDTESPEQRRSRAMAKVGEKKAAARKAAVKTAVGRVKAKAAGAAAAAGIAGSIAKDEARRAGRAAAHAVTSTVQKKKAEVKKGVKGLLRKGLGAVAGGAGAIAQKARKVGAAAGRAADKLGEETISEIAHGTGKKVMPSAKERSSLAKKARAGKDIGKPGKGFGKVAAKAAKQYGSKEAGERVAAAAMFKAQARKEELELDTWDIVLEYLISNGHADTNSEAQYIMSRMDSESIQSIVEAQEARNNPEKYEREQDKKYAPVRGERTPMPPRGNKKREDFEKWYAANVR